MFLSYWNKRSFNCTNVPFSQIVLVGWPKKVSSVYLQYLTFNILVNVKFSEKNIFFIVKLHEIVAKRLYCNIPFHFMKKRLYSLYFYFYFYFYLFSPLIFCWRNVGNLAKPNEKKDQQKGINFMHCTFSS